MVLVRHLLLEKADKPLVDTVQNLFVLMLRLI